MARNATRKNLNNTGPKIDTCGAPLLICTNIKTAIGHSSKFQSILMQLSNTDNIML